jgi:hypothetical protein
MNIITCYYILNVIFMRSPMSDQYNVRQTVDFRVTGNGDHESWQKAVWMPLVSLNNIRDYDTKVKVLYSETGLYVLALMQDNKIVSTMDKDYANLWEEDVFEVFLHTDERQPLYFEYEISPKGFELPLLVPNFSGDFLGWIPWNYEGERKVQKAISVTGESWSAEIYIPWALLKPLQKVPPVKGTQWKANFYRMEYDTGEGEHYAWQPVETNFHQYEKFGILIFE